MHLCKQVICNDSTTAEFDYVMKWLQAALYTNQFFPKNHLFNASFTAKIDKKPEWRKEGLHYFFLKQTFEGNFFELFELIYSNMVLLNEAIISLVHMHSD